MNDVENTTLPRLSCIYQYAFMHMQVDGEVTRCNDNSRHLFSFVYLCFAFNRNQGLIFSCSQDAITTSRRRVLFHAIHLSKRRRRVLV